MAEDSKKSLESVTAYVEEREGEVSQKNLSALTNAAEPPKSAYSLFI